MLIEQETAEKIAELTAEFKSLKARQERDYDNLCRRIDGMWWKVGILAGIVSIVVGKVFGGAMGEFMSALLGGL